MDSKVTNKGAWMFIFTVGIGLGMIFMVSILTMTEATYRDGYKQGQIDAYVGNWKFRLAVQPDSTKVWEKIIK